jgi:hypothetical protein
MSDLKIQENTRGMIQKLISIHEYQMTTLASVQIFHQPSSRGSRDFSGRNQIEVIE